MSDSVRASKWRMTGRCWRCPYAAPPTANPNANAFTSITAVIRLLVLAANRAPDCERMIMANQLARRGGAFAILDTLGFIRMYD